MGHRKVNAPRRGSLAFLPKGRAASQTGRIRFWPHVEEGPILLGFSGYKAGMTHVFMIEDKPRQITRERFMVAGDSLLVLPLPGLNGRGLHLRKKGRQGPVQLLGFLRQRRGQVVGLAEILREIE